MNSALLTENPMALGFDPSHAPFDRLTGPEVETVRAALDINYFRAGETIVAKDAAPQHLYIVMKGHVDERDGEEVLAILGPGDAFDARALIQSGGGPAFIASEETLLYLLPRAVTMRLIAANPRFAAFFYTEISRKLDAAAAEADDARFGATMQAKLGELHLHPAVFVEARDSIEKTTSTMVETDCKAVFVEDFEQVGIVTATDLAKAAILQKLPLDSAIVKVATFDVVSCDIGDFVATALLKMTRHNKRRIAISKKGVYVGVLEDIDLLAFVAGGSQLVGARIDRARSLDDLAREAQEIERQTRMLRRQGVKIDVVCEIVSDLNRRLLARAFRLTAPRSVAEHGCLIVMGSEGRGEQTVRTDQDNGLILSEPVPEADLIAFRAAFTQALTSFGFPPCPGEVMVRNPLWSKTLEAWRADIRSWVATPSETSHMNIAILYDADTVAGDPDLLHAVKAELVAAMRGERARLAHFARAIDQFPTPIGLFNTLLPSRGGEAMDLKKGGIFPIVHGVRAWAIERGLEETNTAKRIARLAEDGALDKHFARELTQSLFCLMTMKLDASLGLSASGARADPGRLTGMDRDLLRDALRIVKQFKDILRRRFNLAMF
jgi:CBS domain-containing protein